MSFADAPSRDRLGFLMVTLTRQWRRFVEEQLAASGLTDATWTPLLHLRAWGDGLRVLVLQFIKSGGNLAA